MTKSILAIMASLVVSNAHALTGSTQIATCSNSIPDNSVNVVLTKHFGGLLPAAHISYTISVSMSTLIGAQPIGTFPVQYYLDTQLPGSPQVYNGEDVQLVIYGDAAPVNGRLAGHISVNKNGVKINEPVSCQL